MLNIWLATLHHMRMITTCAYIFCYLMYVYIIYLTAVYNRGLRRAAIKDIPSAAAFASPLAPLTLQHGILQLIEVQEEGHNDPHAVDPYYGDGTYYDEDDDDSEGEGQNYDPYYGDGTGEDSDDDEEFGQDDDYAYEEGDGGADGDADIAYEVGYEHDEDGGDEVQEYEPYTYTNEENRQQDQQADGRGEGGHDSYTQQHDDHIGTVAGDTNHHRHHHSTLPLRNDSNNNIHGTIITNSINTREDTNATNTNNNNSTEEGMRDYFLAW